MTPSSLLFRWSWIALLALLCASADNRLADEQGSQSEVPTEQHSDGSRSEPDEGKRDHERKVPEPPSSSSTSVMSTTTPWFSFGPEPSPSSVLAELQRVLRAQLFHPAHDWTNAAIALGTGTAFCISSPVMFKWILVVAVGFVCAIVALDEASRVCDIHADQPMQAVVFWAAGLVGGFAAFVGFDGVMVVFAAVVGCLAAEGLRRGIVSKSFARNRWDVAALYLLVVVFCLRYFHTKKHVKVLSSVGPALGGLLASSALCWATGAWHGLLPSLSFSGGRAGPWLDYLRMFWGHSSPAIDAAGGVHVAGRYISFMRALGYVIWAVLFLCGYQLNRAVECRRHRVQGALLQPLIAV